jgi:signal transduction histidine kinase
VTVVEQRLRFATLTAGARAFALVMLAVPVAVSQDYTAIAGAILLAAVWIIGVFVDGVRSIPAMPALMVEAGLVSLTACLALETSTILVAALVVPPFVAGLVRAGVGVIEVMAAQVVVCALTILLSRDISLTTSILMAWFMWSTVGLGIGLIASFMHHSRLEESVTSSYRDARGLLIQFRELSGDLVEGLDPVGIAERILAVSREHLPLAGAVVYAPTSHGFSPLVEGDASDAGDAGADNAHVLLACFDRAEPVVDGPWVAFPLRTEAGVVAVVAGAVMPALRPTPSQLRQSLDEASATLRREALQLDTALLFSSVQHDATAHERKRVARELHDGVAQDLASLGYLIDELTDTSQTDGQRETCGQLRAELTRVVTELRRSLFVLRNEPDDEVSLGQAVEALARHIESRSGIRITVAADEGSKRLRPEVEAELLRIAQEGITNAVKHAQADLVEVVVHVQAPHATVVVRDEGVGLGDGRDDSHGIHIMRERARRIGAELDLRNREDGSGAELRVVLAPGSPHEGPGRILEGTAP